MRTSFTWLIGKTRRERIVSFIAFMFACVAFLWAMLNEMSYGYEGAEGPARLSTNGRFDVSIVLGVFFVCVAVSILCMLIFWLFRFSDGGSE